MTKPDEDLDELAAFAGRGQSLVVYHHADRTAAVEEQARRRLGDIAREVPIKPVVSRRPGLPWHDPVVPGGCHGRTCRVPDGAIPCISAMSGRLCEMFDAIVAGTFPRKRFVKQCTSRFRGNAGQDDRHDHGLPAGLPLGRKTLAGYQEQGPSLSSHLALMRSTGSVEPEIVE